MIPRKPNCGVRPSSSAFATLAAVSMGIGESHPHADAGIRPYRVVDAGSPFLPVHERAAGVARVDRCVGLDHVRHRLRRCSSRCWAIRGGPIAGSHRLLQPERTADGDRRVDRPRRGTARGERCCGCRCPFSVRHYRDVRSSCAADYVDRRRRVPSAKRTVTHRRPRRRGPPSG